MKPVEAHLADALALARPRPPADLPLMQALDCVLAVDVTSEADLPPFDNSAMDGYAVRWRDLVGASPEHPVVLPVDGDVPAGASAPVRLAVGHAMRIMTGAPTPAGADAVVPVEWTDAGTSSVTITRQPSEGAYVRPAGDDVLAGEVLIRAGTRLTYRHLALLAAVGRARVHAVPRPRVVVLSTGTELVQPGRPLSYGQVYDANGIALTAAASDVGCTATHVGAVADNPRAFRALLEEHSAHADVVITSGGVSAGAYEVVKEALGRSGRVRFEKVAMQPGMPQGLGTVGAGGPPLFTLPGNPVSAMVSFEVFVRPVLRRLRGEGDLFRPTVLACAATGWSSPAGKRQFVRAVLEAAEQDAGTASGVGSFSGPTGQPLVRPVGGQGSHLVADLAHATCLAVVPENVESVRSGDVLRCMLLQRD